MLDEAPDSPVSNVEAKATKLSEIGRKMNQRIMGFGQQIQHLSSAYDTPAGISPNMAEKAMKRQAIVGLGCFLVGCCCISFSLRHLFL